MLRDSDFFRKLKRRVFNKPHRMLFCCTHVTLRETEVPIWLDCGLEVVPEEVNTDVMNWQEGKSYDLEQLHPLLGRCRLESTLTSEYYTAARRMRLPQRLGLISEQEREFVNQNFDVIYVATSLEVAVNIRRWFRGKVIFRYFGIFENLQDVRDLSQKYDSRLLKDIICLPIFDSLHELGLQQIFGCCMTLHGFVLPDPIHGRWLGPRNDQHAVVVTSMLHEGSWQNEMIRRMADLAHRLPITILGKNNKIVIPSDIIERFNVTGMLEREEFLHKLATCRLLIHPFANRYHNHYTNLEAVIRGIPVLFRTENPLYLEQPDGLKTQNDSTYYGSYETEEELFAAAEYFFGRPDELTALARRQAILLKIFNRKSVLREARSIVSIFRLSCPREEPVYHEKVDISCFAHAQVASAENLKLQEKFADGNEIVPFHSFAVGDDWSLLTLENCETPRIRVPVEVGSRHFIIGYAGALSPGYYELELNGIVSVGCLARITLEIFQEETRVTARSFYVKHEVDELLVEATVTSHRPWRLSIWVQALRSGYIDVSTLKLSRGHPQSTQIVTNRDLARRIVEDRPIFLPMVIDNERLSDEACSKILINRASEPLELVLGKVDPLPPGRYAIRIEGFGAEVAFLLVEMEVFDDEVITHTQRLISLPNRRNCLLSAEVTLICACAIVLHLRVIGAGEIGITALYFKRCDGDEQLEAADSSHSLNAVFSGGRRLPITAFLPFHLLPSGDLLDGVSITSDVPACFNLPLLKGGKKRTLHCHIAAKRLGELSAVVELWGRDGFVNRTSCTFVPAMNESVVSIDIDSMEEELRPVLFLNTHGTCEVVIFHLELSEI